MEILTVFFPFFIIGIIVLLFALIMRPKEDFLKEEEKEDRPRFDPYDDESSGERKSPVVDDVADGKTFPVDYGVPNEDHCPSTILVRRPKTRVAYVLFAIFFGPLGVHNFYALRSKAATTQFLMTVLSLGLLSPISGIWALIDICTVEYDGNGNPLE